MYVFQKVNMKSLSFIAVVLLIYKLYIAIAIHFVDPSKLRLDLSSMMFTSPKPEAFALLLSTSTAVIFAQKCCFQVNGIIPSHFH